MLTMLLKNRIFSMMMLAFFTLSLVSCDKEDDIKKPTFKEELTGTWDITSYKVQGSEYIGVLVNTAILRFFPYTGAQGQFEQEVTFWQEGPEILQGSYSVDEQKHQITMDYEGETMVANITITNGKQMLWESVMNGSQLVVKATKR